MIGRPRGGRAAHLRERLLELTQGTPAVARFGAVMAGAANTFVSGRLCLRPSLVQRSFGLWRRFPVRVPSKRLSAEDLIDADHNPIAVDPLGAIDLEGLRLAHYVLVTRSATNCPTLQLKAVDILARARRRARFRKSRAPLQKTAPETTCARDVRDGRPTTRAHLRNVAARTGERRVAATPNASR